MKTNTLCFVLGFLLASAPWSFAQDNTGIVESLAVGYAGGGLYQFARENTGFVLGLAGGLAIIIALAAYWFVKGVKTELRDYRDRSSATVRKIRGRFDRSSKKETITVEPDVEDDFLAESKRAIPIHRRGAERGHDENFHDERFGNKDKRSG